MTDPRWPSSGPSSPDRWPPRGPVPPAQNPAPFPARGPYGPPGPYPPPFSAPGPYAPQGPYPHYGYPPFPPPKKRRSRWLTVGLPVGLVLLLGGCGALFALGTVAVHDVNGATKAADQYGAAVSAGRYEDAQAMLCTVDRNQVTADELAAHYSNPRVVGYQVSGVNVTSFNGQTTASAVLVLRTADGLSNQIRIGVVKESDGWHACP